MSNVNYMERHLTQCRYLIAHRYRYYVLSLPTISDDDFDRAVRVLEILEAEHPELINENSPTQYPEEPTIGWKAWFQLDKPTMRNRFYAT